MKELTQRSQRRAEHRGTSESQNLLVGPSSFYQEGELDSDVASRRVRLASQAMVASMPSQPRVRLIPPIFWSWARRPHWVKRISQSESPEPTRGNAAVRASAM